MADVSKIKGEIPQPEPEKAKKKEKDLEEIREKWGKVGKIDTEQKKKKKPKAQEEEEKKVEETAAPRQGLGAEQKQPSLYEPQGGKTPEIGEGAEPGPMPPSAPPPYYPEAEPIEEPSAPSQPHRKKKAPPPEQVKKVEKKKKAKEALPAKVEKLEKKETALVKEAPPLSPPSKEKVEKPKEKKEEIEAVPMPPEPLPKGAWEAIKESGKKEKEKKAKIESPIPTVPTETTPQPPTAAPTSELPPIAPLPSPYANLPPQMQQLFNRMVGVMTVMHASGISETTLTLDNPQFASSVFYKAQIVITEFSTAPKAFNIELLGSQQALDLITANQEELVAAFQGGNYNFKVNRIDTGYLPSVGEAKKKATRRVRRKRT